MREVGAGGDDALAGLARSSDDAPGCRMRRRVPAGVDGSFIFVAVYCLESLREVHRGITERVVAEGRRQDRPRRFRRRLVPRGLRDPRPCARRRGAAQRSRRGLSSTHASCCTCGSGCRSRTGTGATPRSTTNPSTPRSSGSACPEPVRRRCRSCSRRTPTSATCTAGRPPNRVRRRRRCTATTRASRRDAVEVLAGSRHHVPAGSERADGVPRPDGAGLQVADLPGLRPHPDVLTMASSSGPTSRRPTPTSGACSSCCSGANRRGRGG